MHKIGVKNTAFRPFTGLNTNTDGLSNGFKFTGGRAISANYAISNPKLHRFENLIYKLRKILDQEKKNLRNVKTLCAKEIDQKNQLEKILRQCVDDVKNEITKKKTESKTQYYQKSGGMKIKNGNLTENKGFEKNLSNAER